MRIIHANIGAYPERGGPPVVIANLAAEQARMGHDVCVVSLAPNKLAEQQVRKMLDSVPGGAAVRIHIPEARQRLKWILGVSVNSLLPEGSWDIVHIHELWNPFDYAVSRAAQARRIPYVVTMHGLLSPHRLADRAVKKRLARGLWVDRMLRGAHFVHGLTEFECDAAATLIPQLHLVKIANGFSALPESVGPEAKEMQIRLAGRRFLLFMGRLHIMKGTDLLIAALAAVASRFPDVDLVIAGPDYGQKASMQAEAAEQGVGNRIYFVGMAGGAAKSWLLQHCDAFVLPSRDEGFSVAILEALSMAAPVIMTPECHFPEAAIAGAAIEASTTVESISKAFESVLSNGDLRARMGAAGQSLVENDFTWAKIATEMLAAYRRGVDPKA